MTTRLKINKKVGIVWILMFTVLLFAAPFAKAQPNAGLRFEKTKFRVAIHRNSHRTCYILFKKRTSIPKLAVARRYKIKPMAETVAQVWNQ